MSISLDPDHDRDYVGPDLGPKFETVSKGYQQMTQACKEFGTGHCTTIGIALVLT